MARNLEEETQEFRVASEAETRKKFYQFAASEGDECLFQYVQLINKYDKLIANCYNERERDDLCTLASMEITELLFGRKEVKIIE